MTPISLGIILGIIILSYAFIQFKVASSQMQEPEQKKSNKKILSLLSEKYLLVAEEKVKKEIVRQDYDGRYKRSNQDHILKHYPQWDPLLIEPDGSVLTSFKLKTHHSIKQSHIENVLKGLAADLKQHNIFSADYLLLEFTGVPGEYIIKSSTRDEMQLYSLLLKEGLCFKSPTGDVIRPGFSIDKDGLITLDISQLPIKQTELERALDSFSKAFARTYIPEQIEFKDSKYYITPKKEIEYIFDYKKPLSEQREAIHSIINDMRIKSKKDGMCIFAGELYDSSFSVPERIYIPLKDSPHSLTVGQTRSGKTKGALAELFFISLAYSNYTADGLTPWEGEKIEFLFGDGQKSGSDFFPYLFNSHFAVAVKEDSWAQPSVQLANLIHRAYSEYQIRKELCKKHSVSTVLELNNILPVKLPRLFMIVDEFSGFLTAEGDKSMFKKSISSPGTLANKLRELLSAGASTGVHVWLLSQRYQDTDIPTEFRSNLTNQHFYSMENRDAQLAEVDDNYLAMSKGAYQIKSQGLFCPKTNRNSIPVKLPYIGDRPEEVLTQFFDITKHNTDFDMSLIAVPDKSEFRLEEEVWLRIKKVFLNSIKILSEQPPQAIRATLSYAMIEYKDKKISLGFVEDDEVSVERIHPHLKDDVDYYLLFSITTTNLDKKVDQVNEKLPNVQVLPLSFYRKQLITNCLLQSYNKPLLPFFEGVLDGCINQTEQVEYNETKTEELKSSKDIFADSTGWKYEKGISLIPLTTKELNRITNLSGKGPNNAISKGAQFEALITNYYISINDGSYEVVSGSKLKGSGLVIPKHLENGDGGGDIILKHNDGSITLIQAKAYAPHNPVDDTTTSNWISKTFAWMQPKNIPYKRVFITSSDFTSNALSQLNQNKVQAINGDQFKIMIEKVEAKAPKNKGGRPKKNKDAA